MVNSMTEEEIRLDQTKKVFEALADFINDGSGSYRYLIYHKLGFKYEDYAELISGMTITNAIVKLECLQRQIAIKNEYLVLILDLIYDYDGFNTVGGLKGLIDEVGKYAKYALVNDDKVPIYENNGQKLNILGEEIINK